MDAAILDLCMYVAIWVMWVCMSFENKNNNSNTKLIKYGDKSE